MAPGMNTILTRLSAELIQQYESEGFWGGDTIYSLVRWNADHKPDSFAVRDRFRRLTYRQLLAAADALAADLAAQRPASEVDDYHDIVLHYGPRRVRLTVSVLVPAPRPRFALHGTEASFVKYGLDPQESQLQTGVRIGDPGFGVEDPAQHGLLTFADGRTERIATEPGRYLDYYEGVAAAILDGAPPPVDAADARAGLAIIEAARKGSGAGRRVIDL